MDNRQRAMALSGLMQKCTDTGIQEKLNTLLTEMRRADLLTNLELTKLGNTVARLQAFENQVLGVRKLQRTELETLSILSQAITARSK